jgi:hypothetical protein
MMKFAALALIASATAQSEITTNAANGDIQVSRRQSAGIFELQEQLSTQANTIAQLQASVSTLMSSDSPIAVAAQGIANTMATNTADLLNRAADNRNGLASLVSRMDNVDAALSSQTSAAASRAAALEASISTSLGSVSSTLTAQVERSINGVESTLTAMDTQINRSVTASLRTVTLGLAAKRDKHTPVWSGTCNNRPHGGWHDFCLNGVYTNHPAPAFRKASNTRFQSLQPHVYDLGFRRMFTSCNWAHMQWMINNQGKIQTHEHCGHCGAWMDNEIRVLEKIPAGQQFWARAHSSCGWTTWHQGQYSRITVIAHPLVE